MDLIRSFTSEVLRSDSRYILMPRIVEFTDELFEKDRDHESQEPGYSKVFAQKN